jgi:uncharacterized Tic20 family protein
MSSKFEALEKLYELRKKGIITEEEFIREKDLLLNKNSATKNGNLLGLEENTYCMLIHLSLLLAIFHFSLGIIAPLLLWALNKETHPNVDNNGRVAFNWIISMAIYTLAIFLVSLPLGFSFAFSIGNPLSMFSSFIPLIILYVLNVIFVIRAALKANAGEVATYPLSFRFIKQK